MSQICKDLQCLKYEIFILQKVYFNQHKKIHLDLIYILYTQGYNLTHLGNRSCIFPEILNANFYLIEFIFTH